jgi:SNF2 family DNA or RNA helicase
MLLNRPSPAVQADRRDLGTALVGSSVRALSLRPYQIQGLEYLRKNNGCGALIWEMRLGKTITTIRFLSQRKDAKRILVVGPYSCLAGWQSDLKRENQFIHPIYQVEPKTRFDCLTQATKFFGWFLINKESFLYCDILSFQWDAIVEDETWLANPKAQVTKYFLNHTTSKYRILLTGTPAPENELQYYTQLEWVDSILPFKSFWDFRIRCFRPEGNDWKITLKGRQILAKALASRCSILTRKDVNLNKEKIYEKRMVQLSTSTWKKYLEAESALFEDRILKWSGQRRDITRRLCSGKEKEVELISLLQGELRNEKVIIWADYVEEVERVAALLDCNYVHGGVSVEDRENIRAYFLSPQGKYLVAQPQCWKWGTNLTGVDIVIFFSLPQSLMTWQQVQERTVDLQSKDSLLIITLLAEDTVDEDILEGLNAKESNAQILDRIRRRMAHHRAT